MQTQPHDTLEVPGQDSAIERTQTAGGVGRRRGLSNAARSIVSRFSNEDHELPPHEYETEVVDYLDVIGMSSLHQTSELLLTAF
jgi:hypothetical protein